jgi:hypothetical protein
VSDKPKPGDNSFIGPISVQQKANTVDEKSRYARERHLFRNNDGTWNKKTKLEPTPNLPSGFELKRYTKSGSGDGNNELKTSTNANFTGLFFSALPNYFIQEALSLRSLTGNEILQVAHRENFYTTGEVLNRNIIDIVESREFYSSTQIIKLQMPDYSYLFQNNVAAYDVSLASSIVTISIPSSKMTQSAKIQVETFAPRYIKNDTIYT